jgi:hypothetical protein
MADEFEHLAAKKIRLVDIQKSIKPFASRKTAAISRTRYGYDDLDDEGDPEVDINWGDD